MCVFTSWDIKRGKLNNYYVSSGKLYIFRVKFLIPFSHAILIKWSTRSPTSMSFRK